MAFFTNIAYGKSPSTGVYGENGLPLYVDNRHGNVRDGGTISDTANWKSSALGDSSEIVTIVSGVGGVVSANQAASINAGTQVISVAQTTIAGISNTTLQGGQSNSANEANTPLQLDVLRTYYYKTAVVAGNWNEFTGAFSSGPSNAASGVYDITKASDTAGTVRASGTDVAANPSQAYPGTLTYRDGSPNPTNDFYQARNNW
jgi:hypothetical protein